MKKYRQLLVSVTKADCTFKYYKGSGSGGQKKNKTANCCQCTHKESGAQACSEDGRSKDYNTRNAFKKMSETEKFKKWLKIEIARANGTLAQIDTKIESEMEKVRVEIKENGRWVDERAKKSTESN